MDITKSELESLYNQDGMTLMVMSRLKKCSYGKIQKLMQIHGIDRRKPGFKKGTKFTDEHRQNLSKSMTGRRLDKKAGAHGKRFWHKCQDGKVVSMRSRWEVLYANHLTSIDSVWEYEPKTFILSNGSAYTPDFYLPEEDNYIEVKGWMTDECRSKMELFEKDYPDKNVLILQKKHLLRLGIDLSEKVIGEDRPENICETCEDKYFPKSNSQRFCSNPCKNKWISNNRNNMKSTQKINSRKYNGKQNGKHNNNCKLAESDVLEIRKLRAGGVTLKKIAELKSISIGNVGNIIKGRSWRYLK